MNRFATMFFVVIALLVPGMSAFAQNIGDYSFTNSTGAYTDLGTNGTVITTATLDDAISAAVDIGFTFSFGGVPYTQFKLNTNGWITFNTASTSTTQYVVLSSTETQVIAAIVRDLLGTTAAGTEFRSYTEGTTPNRICKIQYKNIGFYNSGAQAGNGSFQIWLYETSNRVEVRYATFDANFTTNTVQVGLKSSSTATANIRSLAGTGATTWTLPTAGNSSTSTMDVSSTIVPDSGRIYTFRPPPVQIAHTALTNTTSTSARTVSAVITADLGIATGANGPRMYYRPGTSGSYTAVSMTNTGGNNWEATIPGQPGGAIVQYYIAAQDLDSPPTLGTSPGGGGGINPPGTTPPPTPYQYIITAPLSGAYTINKDGGGNYSSFGEAFSVLNASGVGGPTTFTVTGTGSTVTYAEGNLLLGGTYVGGFPQSALLTTLSSTRPLTFVAASGKTINMSGAGVSTTIDYVFRLQGVDYVTFDGINIVDTATTVTTQFEFGYVIGNAFNNDGANNNTIKNMTISLVRTNTGQTNGPYGVLVQNGTALVAALGTAGTYDSRNNNNKIQNFTIRGVKRGISFSGLTVPAFDQGNEISGPAFTSATGGTWVGGSRITSIGGATSGTDWGIGIDAQKNMKVFNVQIDSLVGTTAGTAASGIHFGTAASTALGADNVEIYNNVIHNLNHTNSTTSGIVGIRASGTALHTSKIYNNAIYDIQAPLATGANVMVGMMLTNTGTGTKFELYNNSINITAPTAAAGIAKGIAFGLAGAVITAKNNAIQVTGGGSTGGAILLDFGATSPTLLDFSNNVYNVGTTGPTDRRMAVYGSANRQNLIDWQSTRPTPSDGVDQRSGYGDPGFNSGTDLTYGATNRIDNSGVPVTGLSTSADILGVARSATTPDIGVFEGNFTSGFVDVAGAGIQITPLEGSVASDIRVIITDNVNTANNIRARLWYRIAGSASAFSALVPDVVPGSGNNGEYRWGASLRALAAGTYEYYIVARDTAGNSYADPTMTPSATSPGFTTSPADPNWAGTNPFASAGFRTFQNAGAVLAGGTYSVGPTGTYPSLTAVANEVNTKPLSGNVVFELQPTYTGAGEVYPIVFNQPSYTVPGPLTITIRPNSSVVVPLVTAGNPGGSNSLIVLDGMRDMTLDGRPGGTGTSRMWTIINNKDSAATNASGEAIRLVNDALRNTFRWLTLQANTTTGFGGVINIGSTFFGGQGNNFNTVSNCDIGPFAGAVTATPPNPIRGIGAVGGGTNVYNKNNTYSNNLIHDFHSLTSNPIGIFLAGEVGSTITGNSIYQTAPRSGLAAFALGIAVNPATGPGVTITNNFIGGSAPQCGGGPMTIATVGATAVFYGMQVNVGQFTSATTINGNTMTNWDLTSANTTGGLIVGCGVNLTTTTNAMPVSIRNNIIGSSTTDTTNPAIRLTSTSTAAPSSMSGIFLSANGVCEVVGNSIGGVKLMTTSTGTTGFIGIQQQTAGIATRIDSNLIGSASVAGNIYQTTNAIVNGIVSIIGGSSITNNTVANILSMTPAGGTGQTFLGISGTAGLMNISNNTIRDVVTNSISTGTTGTAAACGINMTSTNLGHVIDNNRIYNLTVSPATPTVMAYCQGVYISSSTSGGVFSRNWIYNLVNNSTSTSAFIRGLHNNFGINWTYVNNMISLGGGVTNDINIRGIVDFSDAGTTGAGNYYYNSINITGAVPGGTINTYCWFRSTSSTPQTFRNNIFVNTRTGATGVARGFAIANNTSAGGWPATASDYNVFYTGSDTVAQWLSVNRTLADWQTASGGDANTIVCDPAFVSATDLHINQTSSCPSNNGTPIAGITTDFDGQTRSATTPDRGADEYAAAMSGTFTIGTGGNFANIKAFFDAINATVVSGDITANIISNISESASAVLNPVTYINGGPWTITLRPLGGARIDTSTIAGPMIDLNGASNIVFDGNITGVKSLTLRNTSATATASAIRLINDARNNTVTNCILEGAGTSVTTGGVITFGTSASGTTGNSNNTISNNNIRDLSTTGVRPSACIASNGTATATNKDNTIINNNIFNFITNGINVSATGNGGGWNISGNSFYYNNATVPSAAQTALNLNPGVISGAGCMVYGNYVGGQAPLAGGSAWTNSGNVQIAGIFVTVDTVNATTVRRNVVRNIVKSGVGAGGVFPIGILNGSAIVDSNTVGGLGVMERPVSMQIPVHRMNTPRDQNSGGEVASREAGLLLDVQPEHTMATAIPDEAEADGPSPEATVEFVLDEAFGIINAGTGITTGIQNQSAAVVTIRDNEISLLFNSLIGSTSGVRGINNGGTAASRTKILRNSIHDIATYTTGALTTPAAAAITWFPASFTGPDNEITMNVGYAISARDSGAVASNPMGMLITNNAAPVTRNLVYDIRNASTGTTATAPPTATGFYLRAQSASLIANNMASVGSGQSSNTVFSAFWNGSGTINTGFLYYNSGLVTGVAGSGSLGSWAFLRGAHVTTSVFTNWTLRNNILVNARTGGTGSHYAIGNQGTRPDSMWFATSSDYNIFNSPDTNTLGLWGTTNQTMAQWRTTTGGDAQTLTGDPGFVGATNLHISPSSQLPSNNGTPIAEVTDDFDGDLRSATTPDRGADEYVATGGGPILFENFDSGPFPPAGWSTYIVAGDSGWRSATVEPLSPPTHAFNRYQPAGTMGSKFLVTRRVIIPSATTVYELSFWIKRFYTTPFDPDTVYVRRSTTDSLPGSFGPAIYKCYTGPLADTATNPNIYGISYRKFKTTLTGYAGPLFIAFDHQDNDGQTLYLDDVKIDVQTDVHDIGAISLGPAAEPPLQPASPLEYARNTSGGPDRSEKELEELPISVGKGMRGEMGAGLAAPPKQELGIQLEILHGNTVFDNPTDITLRAIVQNFGSFVENSYQLGWRLDAVSQTPVSNTRPLQIAGRDTFYLTFPTPAPGTHTARAWTILAGDTNPANDSTNVYSFEVLPPNIILQEGFNGTIPPYPTGWHTKNLDGGTTTPDWFQGNLAVFPPYEGAGYIGCNYQRSNGFYIDRWLVSPNAGGALASPETVVDSLTFWSRSPDGSTFPDSIQIRVSTTDTAAASFTIVLDYFKVSTTGWQRRAYALPNAPNRYVAFRYLHYAGGPSGANSDYIGIDDVRITRTTTPATGTWAAQTSGVTTALYTAKAVSPSVAWAAGAGGVVLRTTNGGTTWTNVGGAGIANRDVYAMEAISANTAFVGTWVSSAGPASIYRTTNGGADWSLVFNQPNGFINGIGMVDATTGYAEGDPENSIWTLLKTTDGGATWNPMSPSLPQAGTEAGWNNSFQVMGNNIWFGTSNSRIYRTTNAGASWTFGTTPTANSYDLHFNNPMEGFAAGTGGMRTTDGGATWTAVTIPGSGNVLGVSGAGAPDFWYVRGTGIYRSTDNGVTWASEFTASGTQNHVDFIPGGIPGWSVSSNGSISKFSPPVSVGPEPEIPTMFTLSQNYPNPFNPTTTINYALPQQASVSLTIYNILGQEVITLVSDVQPAGYHTAVWNGLNRYGSQVATGVYFYRLEARGSDGSGVFKAIKKMLMLK
jgi:photosystem II stability/assembly factor-like uncharacterized protein